MFERYTEPARRAIFFARYTAGKTGSSEITVGHLVLGLCHDQNNRVNLALGLAARQDEFAAKIGIVTTNDISSDLHTEIPLERDAKMVLAYAAQESDRYGDQEIDVDHLLLGIFCFPNNSFTVLSEMGLEQEALQSRFREHRLLLPPSKSKFYFWFRKTRRKTNRTLIAVLLVPGAIIIFELLSQILIKVLAWLHTAL